ncbi:hypothetical protein ACFE04_021705 [Oxalis oulophora]
MSFINTTVPKQQINNANDLIAELEKLEVADVIRKRQTVDPGKQLNTMKLLMTQLEGYKKKRFLNTYWKQIIKDSNNPRSGVTLDRTRWLFGGTCYRRMVEPFDIAEFYKAKGRRDYINNGRSEHYKKLEKLLAEVGKCKDDNSNIDKDENDYSSRQDLIEFEKYVVSLMKNYTVSPEIFFPKSSFMEWWRWYEEIKGMNYNSELTEIMRKYRYELYAKGKLEL